LHPKISQHFPQHFGEAGGDMGITNDRGRFYFVKRVPRRFQHIDPRSQVRVALHTDSREEARRKAPQVEAGLLAYWEALAAGNGDDAAAQYRAARALAAARGFTYRPQADLLIPTAIDDLLARLSALARPGGAVAPYEDAAALLGVVEAPRPAFSAVLTEFLDLTTDRLVGKSPAQVRRWRLPREKAVRNFIEAVGDKPIDEIGRQDALTFRRWWRDRVEANGLNPHTANKDFGRLADVFGTWAELQGRQLDNPFRSLRFKEQGAREAHPFSVDWIRGRPAFGGHRRPGGGLRDQRSGSAFPGPGARRPDPENRPFAPRYPAPRRLARRRAAPCRGGRSGPLPRPQ
jgi:hypothetical protein